MQGSRAESPSREALAGQPRGGGCYIDSQVKYASIREGEPMRSIPHAITRAPQSCQCCRDPVVMASARLKRLRTGHRRSCCQSSDPLTIWRVKQDGALGCVDVSFAAAVACRAVYIILAHASA